MCTLVQVCHHVPTFNLYCPMILYLEVDLSVLSLLSHGGQVGCPKDSVPMVPRTGGMS